MPRRQAIRWHNGGQAGAAAQLGPATGPVAAQSGRRRRAARVRARGRAPRSPATSRPATTSPTPPTRTCCAARSRSGPELGRAGERGVGETVLAAVRATRRVAGANTNLGIVLLLAPLARAALLGGPLRDRAGGGARRAHARRRARRVRGDPRGRGGRPRRARSSTTCARRRPSRCARRWPPPPTATRSQPSTPPATP